MKEKQAEILWSKLISGDQNAIGGLYELFIDDLFAYGIQVSTDKNFIMDCIHDLFLNLYKYKNKLAMTDNVKYYLLKSLKNKIYKKGKGKVIYLSEEIFIKAQDNINFTKSFEDTIMDNELLDEQLFKLSNALCFLSKKQRQGIFLRFTQEKGYEEISKIMNVSIETSRTIIYRAIKVLRNHLTMIIILLKTFF